MEKKQNITVSMKVREIMYDIMNKTHLTGQAREAAGKGYESAAYMQASEDDETSYQLRREVSNAFSSIKVRLGEYLDENKTMTDNLVNAAVDAIDTEDEQAKMRVLREAGERMTGVGGEGTAAAFMGSLSQPNASYANSLKLAKAALASSDGSLSAENREILEAAVAKAEAKAELVLSFKMPSNFHRAAVDSLGDGCHQYIVYKSIAAWYVLTNPEEVNTYQALAEEALETAKRALYKRARPVRPSY